MPHLRFRAVTENCVQTMSEELPGILAPVLKTSEDNFSFELVATTYFEKGSKTNSYPFIEFLWFDRGQEVQDKCAAILTEKVKTYLASSITEKTITTSSDVVIVFLNLAKNQYYENSQSFT